MSAPFDRPPLAVDIYAIGRWNHANLRARQDYYAHPIASCVYGGCDNLAKVGVICDWHQRQLADDRARKRGAA